MQIIGPFNTRKTYTIEAVNKYIEHLGYKVKHYGAYQRKNFTPVKIYRYYEIVESGKKNFICTACFSF